MSRMMPRNHDIPRDWYPHKKQKNVLVIDIEGHLFYVRYNRIIPDEVYYVYYSFNNYLINFKSPVHFTMDYRVAFPDIHDPDIDFFDGWKRYTRTGVCEDWFYLKQDII